MNTLKNHLKVCDPSIYDAVLAEEAANRKRRDLRDLHESHQKLIDKSVAVFVGATSAPYSVINNEHFRRMLQALDARYCIPGRTRLQSLIDDVLRTMKVRIQGAMSNARKINFVRTFGLKKV